MAFFPGIHTYSQKLQCHIYFKALLQFNTDSNSTGAMLSNRMLCLSVLHAEYVQGIYIYNSSVVL